MYLSNLFMVPLNSLLIFNYILYLSALAASIELVYSDYRNMKNQFNSIIYLNGRRCQNSVVGMAIYNHLALDIPSLSKHEKFVSSTPFLV